jgi:hypothetical protein
MSDKDRIKSRLQKILELARQGVGGEKDNAQSVLDKLLKNHGLSLEDLEREELEVCEFSYRDALEKDLLKQVLYSVLQVSSLSVRVESGNSKKMAIKATKAQKLELELAYGLYRESFKKEQDRLFRAFIHKNKLYGPGLPEEDAVSAPAPRQMSKEDELAIAIMMTAMKTTHLHKALPNTATIQ